MVVNEDMIRLDCDCVRITTTVNCTLWLRVTRCHSLSRSQSLQLLLTFSARLYPTAASIAQQLHSANLHCFTERPLEPPQSRPAVSVVDRPPSTCGVRVSAGPPPLCFAAKVSDSAEPGMSSAGSSGIGSGSGSGGYGPGLSPRVNRSPRSPSSTRLLYPSSRPDSPSKEWPKTCQTKTKQASATHYSLPASHKGSMRAFVWSLRCRWLVGTTQRHVSPLTWSCAPVASSCELVRCCG